MSRNIPTSIGGIASIIILALMLAFLADVAAAQTSSTSICDRFPVLSQRFPSCRETPPPPPPADVCPNVPGNQASGPCADQQCQEQGGTWNGTACVMPPPPPPSPDDGRRNICERYSLSSRDAPPESCDVCLNVPGVQLQGPCADKMCVDDGGTWDGNACVMPPPDVCPNVPGDQAAGPCADQQCVDQGGTWNGTSCELPPPPPVDVCPNVPGNQATGPCADQQCADDGGTWNGTSCDMPPPPPVDVCPNVPGDQPEGPCADQQCTDNGGTWDGTSCVMPPPPPQCSDGIDNDGDGSIDFPSDGGCTSANDNDETGSGGAAGGGGGAASSFFASKYSGYGNQSMPAGSNDVKLGSFTLFAGSAEGLTVNTIVVELSSGDAASITDLRIRGATSGTQIGDSIPGPSTINSFAADTFIPAGANMTFDIYGDIVAAAGSGSDTLVPILGSGTTATGASSGTAFTILSDVTLQTITVVQGGSLTVTRDIDTPFSSNVIAGTTMVHVGKFDFESVNSSFVVQEIQVKIPTDASTSVANVTLKYKDASGTEQTASQALIIPTGSQPYAIAPFSGLSMFVPMNGSADLDVYVDIPTIASGAKSGAAVSVVLDADSGFKAVDVSGNTDTTVAGTDLASNALPAFGTKYVKKSIPTLARLTSGYVTNTVASGIGLYRFSITSDAAGSIEWRELSFTVTTVATNLFNWVMYDVTSGLEFQINDTATTTSRGGTGTNLSICPGTNCQNGEAIAVGAGQTRNYELRATVTGWGSAGDSFSIRFADDMLPVVNAPALSLHTDSNMVWSDRSALGHSTTTSDWTNGYVVKDMDNDSRTCQFGQTTNCTP